MATTLTAHSSSSSYSPRSWPDLPDGLLHSILIRLPGIRDLLAFSSVCRSWRSFAASTISASPTSLFPPLLIFPHLEYRSRRRRRLSVSRLELFDPAIPPPFGTLKTLDLSPIEQAILSLPFLSSSHGHLFFLSRRRQILVVNFITGCKIISPVLPLDHCPPFDSRIAQLTGPVSSPSCTLIFLTEGYLLLWKINSPGWISHLLDDSLTNLRQMVVVGRRIWTLELGNILSFIEMPQDLCSEELEVKWWHSFSSSEIVRLVDCDGDILCVCFVPFAEGRDTKVEVLQIDMSNDGLRLIKKNNLGNRALFLSAAVNVPGWVCNDPERWGGKRNCIYYACGTDRMWLELEVGRFASKSLFSQPNRSICSFPIWDKASILQ